MKKTAFILAVLLSFAFSASAQSKQETKWYDKTIKANTVSAYDLFLKRYPKSVYRQKIDSLKYDALYVTHMGNKEALDIITVLVPHLKAKNEQPDYFKAAALRDEGRDFILGVSVYEDDMPFDSVRFYLSEKINGIWQMPRVKSMPKYFVENDKIFSVLTSDETIVTIEEVKWLHFSYRNFSKDGEKIEQVEALMPVGIHEFDNQMPGLYCQAFYGSHLSGNRIEGRIDCFEGENETETPTSPSFLFLLDRLNSNESLVPIAKEDLLSDQAVEWWLKNNPNAQTSAKNIKFGTLPENSSIVRLFKANREKESGSGWSAALFDIRGYTVICAKTPSGNYVLVWCEPRFKDRSSDRILNTIYFEKGTNLTLFYYQGRKAFKYKVNLSGKTISR